MPLKQKSPRAVSPEGVKEFPWSFDGKGSPPCGSGCVCSGGDCGSGNAKQSFAGRIPKRSLGTTQNCFILAVALCPAKRRFAFFPMGSHARLAAEIPDIFLPLARNENSGMTMLFFSLGGVPVSVCVLTTGVVIRRRAVSGETARGGFGLGDSFTCSELGNDTELFHPRRRAVSCEAALRILSNGEACPPCGGDSGYFPSACAK